MMHVRVTENGEMWRMQSAIWGQV